MESLRPGKFDPKLIDPEPDAEGVLALTFLLELPFCLRIAEARFLVSGGGGGWPGWNGHAIGHIAGMAPIPENLAPLYRVDLSQVRVEHRAELLAAELAFSDWDGFDRGAPPHPSLQGDEAVLRSCSRVTVYTRESDLPFPDDVDPSEHEFLEWTSRCFDAALGILNQYLVALAALNDEWHISSISRSDLPRTTPWRLEVYPADGEREPLHGTIDAHSTLRDDLPDERPAEEIEGAIELVHRYRRGEMPFFDFIEHYQAAEHHLGSGRNSQSVISATTSIEVLVNTLFRSLWQLLELEPDGLERALNAPFRNQLVEHLPRFLEVDGLDPNDADCAPGRWFRDCYDLRNRVVHGGHKPSSPEGMNAKLATRAFASWMGAQLKSDERTNWIAEMLQAPPRR